MNLLHYYRWQRYRHPNWFIRHCFLSRQIDFLDLHFLHCDQWQQSQQTDYFILPKNPMQQIGRLASILLLVDQLQPCWSPSRKSQWNFQFEFGRLKRWYGCWQEHRGPRLRCSLWEYQAMLRFLLEAFPRDLQEVVSAGNNFPWLVESVFSNTTGLATNLRLVWMNHTFPFFI